MLKIVIMTAAGFLSGSIMYAYLLPKWFRGVDARTYCEDANPGGMSAIAAAGLPMGVVCIALDVLKAAVPVFIAASVLRISGYGLVPVVAAPVLGHAFTPFLKFRGGKAIAAAFGAMFGMVGISWAFVLLAAPMLLFTFVFVLHPDTAKAVGGFAVTALLCLVIEPLWELKLATLIICIAVCYKNLYKPNKGELYASLGSLQFFLEDKRIKLRKGT